MKFLCPACQSLAEIAAVRAQGAQVIFTCSQCGAEAAQETPPPAPGAVASSGPKALPRLTPSRPLAALSPVGTEVGTGAGAVVLPLRSLPTLPEEHADDPFFVPPDRCPKCLSHRSDEPACKRCGLLRERALPEYFLPTLPVRDAWKKLWPQWTNALEHERFRQAAMAQGELAEAGRLYQLRLARVPNDPEAEFGRSELLRLVSTVGMMERTQKPDTRRIRQLGWGLFMVLVTGLAGLVARGLLGSR